MPKAWISNKLLDKYTALYDSFCEEMDCECPTFSTWLIMHIENIDNPKSYLDQ